MEFTDLPNLASPQLNTKVVFATDEWFASCDNMVKDEDAVWKQDLYTTYGKWMDGWESRRRRTEGHDWCIIKLGIPGIIRAIEVDTAFFTGNFSPKVSIQGVYLEEESSEHAQMEELIRVRDLTKKPDEGRIGTCATPEEFDLVHAAETDRWNMLVPLTPLGAGYEATRKTLFPIAAGNGRISHLRLNMGPDGGIARIRVYGEVTVSPEKIPFDRDIDLACVEYGGLALACSNKHYGHPRNLVAPGRGNCMGDGWETARQPKRPAVYERGSDGLMVLPGCDWSIIKLGVPGVVSMIEVDTNFYKGNYPESCLIEACYLPNAPTDILKRNNSSSGGGGGGDDTPIDADFPWKVILSRSRLSSSAKHFFSDELVKIGPISHVKMTIYPDGGVMRLRVLGRKSPDSKL